MHVCTHRVESKMQARKTQLNIWSSEDDLNVKPGRPQVFVVVLKCIPFAGQIKIQIINNIL